jgi:hypothetical protein
MPDPTSAELEAEREFIAAYFEEREKLVAFLPTLDEQGHELEARTLCLVYIEGLANGLSLPNQHSAKYFSKALAAHSGNGELFSLVLPQWLMKALPWNSAPKDLRADLTTAIETLPQDQAFLPTEFLDTVKPLLIPAYFMWLEREVWRGSIANAVYTSLRSPAVHFGGVTHGISFGKSKFRGRSIPRIDFHNLYPALVSLLARAKQVSEATGAWFGVA